MLDTKKRVIQASHDLGMHNDGYPHYECDACFEKDYRRYIKSCSAVMTATGHRARIADFEAFTEALVYNSNRDYALYGSPAVTIADFLGVKHDSPGFEAIFRESAKHFYL